MDQIRVIQPYHVAGTWVFDDPAVDLGYNRKLWMTQ